MMYCQDFFHYVQSTPCSSVHVLFVPCRQLDQQVQELAQPSKQFPRIVFKTVYARRRYYQYTVRAMCM